MNQIIEIACKENEEKNKPPEPVVSQEPPKKEEKTTQASPLPTFPQPSQTTQISPLQPTQSTSQIQPTHSQLPQSTQPSSLQSSQTTQPLQSPVQFTQTQSTPSLQPLQSTQTQPSPLQSPQPTQSLQSSVQFTPPNQTMRYPSQTSNSQTPAQASQSQSNSNLEPVINQEATGVSDLAWKAYNHTRQYYLNVKQLESQVKQIPNCNKIFEDIQQCVNTLSRKGKQVDSKKQILGTLFAQLSREPQHMYLYCLHHLALCIVKQGQVQVALNPESALPYVMIAIDVAKNHPNFVQLFIGNFNEECPYTIPWFPPMKQGQTEQDYLHETLKMKRIRSPAGEYKGHESKEAYTKRMVGMVRLYAYFLAATNETITYAWTYLSRILNLKPREISAPLVLAILQTIGNAMVRIYRRQFSKIMSYILNDWLPQVPDTIPAKNLLRNLLNDYERTNTIPIPPGNELDYGEDL